MARVKLRALLRQVQRHLIGFTRTVFAPPITVPIDRIGPPPPPVSFLGHADDDRMPLVLIVDCLHDLPPHFAESASIPRLGEIILGLRRHAACSATHAAGRETPCRINKNSQQKLARKSATPLPTKNHKRDLKTKVREKGRQRSRERGSFGPKQQWWLAPPHYVP